MDRRTDGDRDVWAWDGGTGVRGSYSDGNTAASSWVDVRFQGDGLFIQTDAGETVETWPMDQIRIASQAGASLVLTRLGGRSRLRIADPMDIESLRKHLPKALRANRDQVVRVGRLGWSVIVAGAAFTALAGALIAEPNLAKPLIPDFWFERLGARYAEALAPEGHRCTGAEGSQVILQAAAALAEQDGHRKPLFVWVVNADVRNAFATAGGHIVLFRGLIDMTETPAELMGVLAHEIGHVSAGHPETAMVRGVGFSAIIQVLALGLGLSPDAASIGATMGLLQYSRDAEREADDRAISTMRAVGYDPQGLATILAKLTAGKDSEEEQEGYAIMLASHPATAERKQRINVHAGSGSDNGPLSDAQWEAVKAICSADGAPLTFRELIRRKSLF